MSILTILNVRRQFNLNGDFKCEICGESGKHNYKCPNFTQLKPLYYCSICGEGIFDGEEYIENDNGEYRHYECFYGLRELLGWLGYEIKTMREIM